MTNQTLKYMAGNELSSLKITRGARTYFFDILSSRSGDFYLKISESIRSGSRFEHHRLMIFDKDINCFMTLLQRTLLDYKALKSRKNEAPENSKKNRVEADSKKNARRWTAADDDKLEVLFCEGKNESELCEIFGRNVRAINLRIKKLELAEKYPK